VAFIHFTTHQENAMLSNIITHTPLYVWAILAFLVSRGVTAMRQRELAFKSLCIIPLVMLLLSLQDISNKFALAPLPLAAWLAGACVAGGLAWRMGAARISAGSAPGRVTVAGSVLPLLLMVSIFCTKYATAVALAIAPDLAGRALFMIAVCLLFGAFNGLFLGRLARDTSAYLQLDGTRAHA
jgi:hypothetical protein